MWICFSFIKVDRRNAIIYVLNKTPPTQGSRKVVRFMQNEPQFILYRAQRKNVNIVSCTVCGFVRTFVYVLCILIYVDCLWYNVHRVVSLGLLLWFISFLAVSHSSDCVFDMVVHCSGTQIQSWRHWRQSLVWRNIFCTKPIK